MTLYADILYRNEFLSVQGTVVYVISNVAFIKDPHVCVCAIAHTSTTEQKIKQHLNLKKVWLNFQSLFCVRKFLNMERLNSNINGVCVSTSSVASVQSGTNHKRAEECGETHPL